MVSMRVVEQFIKKHMGSDTVSALSILEKHTGIQTQIKISGRPKSDQIGITSYRPRKLEDMSMRATIKFIKENMDGDTNLALRLFEKHTKKRADIKKGGNPKASIYSEHIWYLFIWSQIHNYGKSFDAVETELMKLNNNIKKRNGSVIKNNINRDRYYKWVKENKEFLKQDNSVQIKNLESVFEQFNEDMQS